MLLAVEMPFLIAVSLLIKKTLTLQSFLQNCYYPAEVEGRSASPK